MKLAILAIITLLVFSNLAQADPFDHIMSRSSTKSDFGKWLEKKVWPGAKARGISRRTFDKALSSVKPDWDIPDLIKPGSKKTPSGKQSEFSSPSKYFRPGGINYLVRHGSGLLRTWKDELDVIERRYGVPRNIIIAIWGRETNYGKAALPQSAIRTLATLAYAGSRKEMFLNELLSALTIVEKHRIKPSELKSSWAGALGHPQFMPSKYLQYAVDFDGNGKADIWNSVPDSLASIANFLKQHDWRSNRDWGFESVVPQSVSCTLEGPDQGQPISAWSKMGVKRVKDRVFPAKELPLNGYLLFPAGRFGPVFLVTENFYVLKQYNESDLYALFIGHVADRLSGGKDFVNQWGKVGSFYRSDVRDMQLALEKQGHDVGGADGLVGFKTRRSVGKWQEQQGMRATCFPDAALVKKFAQ